MLNAVGGGGEGGAVRITVLYAEGCAATPPTVELVKSIARDLNIPITMEMIVVGTQEQAQELRFLGSPTVQVEGFDIDPSARESAVFGLT